MKSQHMSLGILNQLYRGWT